MMSAWMIYAAVLTAFAYLAAMAAEQVMWIWRLPRRLPWLIAMGVAVIGPLALPIMNEARESRPTLESRSHVASAHLTTPVAQGAAIAHGVRTVRTDLQTRAKPAQFGDVTALLEPFAVRGWIASSVVALLALLVTCTRFRRERAAWREMELDGTRVLVARRHGPAVVGVWRPRIVIPEWSLSLDVGARSLILQHEREHVAARDPQWLFVAALCVALFPWNPPLWLIVRGLRRTIELDCDERVLDAGLDVERYGSLLLQFAAHRAKPLGFAAGLIGRQSLLEQRIRVMTATRPRRPLLVSLPLVLGITIATLGATRTSVPRSPFARIGTRGSPKTRVAVAAPNTALIAAAPMAAQVRVGSKLSLSRVGPEPKINADWENAPIQFVIDAFASFSHRNINAAPDVNGFITAHVVQQPWATALTFIMAAHGFSVTFNADSSITISVGRSSKDSLPSQYVEGPSSLRGITGTVTDAETGRGISGAHINVVGNQAIGAHNETWTNDRGQFSLLGPDGEVWLDACAAGYEFTRVTLSPADSVASFRGQRAETMVRDSALHFSIIDFPRSWNISKEGLFMVDGQRVGTARTARRGCFMEGPGEFLFGRIEYRLP